MSLAGIYDGALSAMFVLAAVTCLALLFIAAPYGRHSRGGWGPTVSSRIGWILMESPAVVAFSAIFAMGPRHADLVPLLLFAMWQFHYLQRAFVYPFSLPRESKPMPLVVLGSGFAFNVWNAFLNAGWLGTLSHYSRSWLSDPRFLAGVVVFGVGHTINRNADRALGRLRAPGETGYKVPHGGIYEWVSCPNYLGEIIEWVGWALATWSTAGLAFAVYTIANLAPRALSHHRWYRQTFPDYPPQRKALIPLIL